MEEFENLEEVLRIKFLTKPSTLDKNLKTHKKDYLRFCLKTKSESEIIELKKKTGKAWRLLAERRFPAQGAFTAQPIQVRFEKYLIICF